VDTTGTPQAIASRTDIPKPSKLAGRQQQNPRPKMSATVGVLADEPNVLQDAELGRQRADVHLVGPLPTNTSVAGTCRRIR